MMAKSKAAETDNDDAEDLPAVDPPGGPETGPPGGVANDKAKSIVAPPEVVVVTSYSPAACAFPVVTAPAMRVMTWYPTPRIAAPVVQVRVLPAAAVPAAPTHVAVVDDATPPVENVLTFVESAALKYM